MNALSEHQDKTAGDGDLAAFIRANLRIVTPTLVPEIELYVAHPGSGLGRRLGTQGNAPYWAYPWAGGLALARYLLDTPGIVSDRRVLDLGAGSGLVAIAAARGGVQAIVAAETDQNAHAAIGLNAELNDVSILTTTDDLLNSQPSDVDIVLVGDLFYDAALAIRVVAYLDRCLDHGIEVLVGDPGRANLPRQRLRLLAQYQVADFGDAKPSEANAGLVFSFVRQ